MTELINIFIDLIYQGYSEFEIRSFTPDDFYNSFGITTSQADLVKALDEAISRTCAWNSQSFCDC